MKKTKWTIFNKKGDEAAICTEFGCPEVVARLLVNRDVCEKEAVRRFLFPKEEDLYDPFLLKDMDKACDIIIDAISGNTRIRVVGDYDVDGVMAAYILQDGLIKLGATADVYLPHRVRDGYGINTGIVNEAFSDGIGLIVTCDNGIAALEAVKKARELGITIVVTDHHEVGETLVPADAVVDPKRKDCMYPCRDICGAVVAAKLVEALGRKTGKGIKSTDYFEFMCMATVCDVVPLSDENRTIASLGMDVLRKTKNPGLKALKEVKQIADDKLDEYTIGYYLGPCINAAGRVDDAMTALSLLMAKSDAEAEKLAVLCSEMNDDRKAKTQEGQERAKLIIGDPTDDRKVLVVFMEDVHESIVGIVAGQLKEAYNRPAIVLTRSGELLKGSARGVEGYNLFEALSSCKDLLEKYGGHALAAGLSLKEENLEAFRERINRECALSVDDMIPVLRLDAELACEMLTENMIEWIAKMEPYGPPNPRPLFAERDLDLISLSYMGRERNNLLFKLKTPTGRILTAKIFFRASETIEQLERMFGKDEVAKALCGRSNNIKLTLAYRPFVNDFNGEREIQMNIVDIFER